MTDMPDYDDDGFNEDNDDDFDWESEEEAIMNSMYPEGYDPDVDGNIYDDD